MGEGGTLAGETEPAPGPPPTAGPHLPPPSPSAKQPTRLSAVTLDPEGTPLVTEPPDLGCEERRRKNLFGKTVLSDTWDVEKEAAMDAPSGPEDSELPHSPLPR